MYVTAIVLAAGKGLRFKSGVPKPLAKIANLPAIIYSLGVFDSSSYIKDIIVAVNPENSKSIIKEIKRHGIKKIIAVVSGGRLRQDSVMKSLGAIDAKTDFVLVHDAARPFIDKALLSRVIKEAKKCGAAIAGVPVKATIKELRGRIVARTFDRSKLWEIQTPQVFKKSLILEAYRRFGDTRATDDSSIVEKLGVKVAVAMGSYVNIKITTPEDLIIAQAIARNKK
jgi:2-C-methyl-D-erythritol 4-phosphate cytidylyltransferase